MFPPKFRETFVIDFEAESSAEMVCCMDHNLKNRDLFVMRSNGDHLKTSSSSSSSKRDGNDNDKRSHGEDKKKPSGDASNGGGTWFAGSWRRLCQCTVHVLCCRCPGEVRHPLFL